MQRAVSDYFLEVDALLPKNQSKLAANWVIGDLAAALNRAELDISESPVSPKQLAGLLVRIADGTISNQIGRKVFESILNGELDGNADAIIETKGLKQISDSGALEAMVDEVLEKNPAIVEEFRAGKDRAFNSLMGQVMRAAKGKANPQQVTDILKQKLE